MMKLLGQYSFKKTIRPPSSLIRFDAQYSRGTSYPMTECQSIWRKNNFICKISHIELTVIT